LAAFLAAFLGAAFFVAFFAGMGLIPPLVLKSHSISGLSAVDCEKRGGTPSPAKTPEA
jgi:hypothetical protein